MRDDRHSATVDRVADQRCGKLAIVNSNLREVWNDGLECRRDRAVAVGRLAVTTRAVALKYFRTAVVCERDAFERASAGRHERRC